jgi:hypothetical protein
MTIGGNAEIHTAPLSKIHILTTPRSQPKSSQPSSGAPSTASPLLSANSAPSSCKSPFSEWGRRLRSDGSWCRLRYACSWERYAPTSSCPKSNDDLCQTRRGEDVYVAYGKCHFMSIYPCRNCLIRRRYDGGEEDRRQRLTRSSGIYLHRVEVLRMFAALFSIMRGLWLAPALMTVYTCNFVNCQPTITIFMC